MDELIALWPMKVSKTPKRRGPVMPNKGIFVVPKGLKIGPTVALMKIVTTRMGKKSKY